MDPFGTELINGAPYRHTQVRVEQFTPGRASNKFASKNLMAHLGVPVIDMVGTFTSSKYSYAHKRAFPPTSSFQGWICLAAIIIHRRFSISRSLIERYVVTLQFT